MSQIACVGWWEQGGMGRQMMNRLEMKFNGSAITGSGEDCVGAFTLLGTVEGASVVLLKRYVGKHYVDYFGAYDGEGTMHGDWEIDGMKGPWMIKFLKPISTTVDEIREIGIGQ